MKQDASTNATVYIIVTASVCTCTNQFSLHCQSAVLPTITPKSYNSTVVAPIRIMTNEVARMP
jgi:hypothetical protein